MGLQLSFYSAEASPPRMADLAGVLCGPGQAVSFGGGVAARLSVALREDWRARALVDACALRVVEAVRGVSEEGALIVRTAFRADLAPLARHWLRDGPGGSRCDAYLDDHRNGSGDGSGEAPDGASGGASGGVSGAASGGPAGGVDAGQRGGGGAVKAVPETFTLDGGALRLWALVAGRRTEVGHGYLLGLDPGGAQTHRRLAQALAFAGLPSVLVDERAGGPALRVNGSRRLARLAELVGDRPAEVPAFAWPAA